ncbi:MAG: MFS transporter [Planctomycetota bacterium]|nr:MFS transporter [Planctomycetota bacterium]
MTATNVAGAPACASGQATNGSVSRDPEARRNFTLGVVNGSLIQGAFSCISPEIILAPLILHLSGSMVLAGIVGVLNQAFFMLPQMLVSGYIESLPRKIHVYRVCAVLRGLNWLAMTVAFYFLSGDVGGLRGPALAWLVIGFQVVQGFLVGASMLAFQEVVAKTVPAGSRERFFGMRTFLGRLIQIGLTFTWIPFVLERQGAPYPRNHSLLFLTGSVFAVLSMVSFCLVREPEEQAPAPRQSLGGQFRRSLAIWRDDGNFRLLILFRVLGLLSMMALPLLTVFALADPAQGGFGLGGPAHGAEPSPLTAQAQTVFLVTLAVSEALTAGVWAWIAPRISAGKGLAIGVGVRLVLTVLLAGAPLVLGLPRDYRLVVMAALFVLRGAQNVMMMIEMQALVLELAPDENRPTFIGFLNTLSFPLMLGGPVLGAALAKYAGYTPTFIVMAIFSLLSLAIAHRLGQAKQVARELAVRAPIPPTP